MEINFKYIGFFCFFCTRFAQNVTWSLITEQLLTELVSKNPTELGRSTFRNLRRNSRKSIEIQRVPSTRARNLAFPVVDLLVGSCPRSYGGGGARGPQPFVLVWLPAVKGSEKRGRRVAGE